MKQKSPSSNAILAFSKPHSEFFICFFFFWRSYAAV